PKPRARADERAIGFQRSALGYRLVGGTTPAPGTFGTLEVPRLEPNHPPRIEVGGDNDGGAGNSERIRAQPAARAARPRDQYDRQRERSQHRQENSCCVNGSGPETALAERDRGRIADGDRQWQWTNRRDQHRHLYGPESTR